MFVFLNVLHVMVCIILIAVVLLQHGKGADMGAVLGGGASNTVFGSRGAGNFLTKLTTGCAILFMVTSLTLSYVASRDAEADLFGDGVAEMVEAAPGQEAAAGDEAGSADALEEIDAPVLEEVEAPAGTLEEIDPAAGDPTN